MIPSHHTILVLPGGRGKVHRAVKGRNVPVCQPTSQRTWHLLPGGAVPTCRPCQAAWRAQYGGGLKRPS